MTNVANNNITLFLIIVGVSVQFGYGKRFIYRGIHHNKNIFVLLVQNKSNVIDDAFLNYLQILLSILI